MASHRSTSGVLAGIFLSLTLCVSTARAEETLVFELPNGESSYTSRSLSRAPGNGLAIPLPDHENVVTLSAIESGTETKSLKVLNEDGDVEKSIDVSISRVSDLGALYGVAVKGAEGVYITLVDRSAEPTRYYQVSPLFATGRQGGLLHQVTEVSAEELSSAREWGEHERFVPSRTQERLGTITIPEDDWNGGGDPLVGGSWRGIEVLGVSPIEFSQGRTDAEIVNQLTAAFGTANIYYEPLRLKLELVGVQVIRTGSTDPYLAATTAQDADRVLEIAQEQWGGRAEPKRDLVAVFGRGRYGDVYGLAFTRSSCVYPDYSVLFATQGGSSKAAELTLADTLAHEIGHFIGMNHDNGVYSDGPSLMWPLFITNPSGFSQTSVNEYLNWAGPGKKGGTCLGPIDPPNDPDSGGGGSSSLLFEGGANQKVSVREGNSIIRSMRVIGDVGGVEYSVVGLPDGATFDSTTALITYRAGYDVATSRNPKRQFRITVHAKSADSEGTAILRIKVLDMNRAPVFAQALRAELTAVAGSTLRLTVRARDLDRFDRVKLRLTTEKRSLPLSGKSVVEEDGGTVRLKLKLSKKARGTLRLRFVAEDLAGSRATDTIFVHVVSPSV